MKSFTILLLVFACAIASTQALVKCPENACQTVRCGIPNECRDPLTHNIIEHDTMQASGKYRLVPKGGYCGCCALCVKLLQENDNCQAIELLGVPHTTLCDEGLRCDHEKHLCVKA